MNCILKRFILKTINKLLEDYKDNVDVVRFKVKVWLDRSDTIGRFLHGLSDKLDDGNLSEDELKSALDELK